MASMHLDDSLHQLPHMRDYPFLDPEALLHFSCESEGGFEGADFSAFLQPYSLPPSSSPPPSSPCNLPLAMADGLESYPSTSLLVSSAPASPTQLHNPSLLQPCCTPSPLIAPHHHALPDLLLLPPSDAIVPTTRSVAHGCHAHPPNQTAKVLPGGKEFAVSEVGKKKRKVPEKDRRVSPRLPSSPPDASPLTFPPTPHKDEEDDEEYAGDDFFGVGSGDALRVCKVGKSECADGHDEEDGGSQTDWENQLEGLAKSYDNQLPVERKVQEELLSLQVREFNRRVLDLKLDVRTVDQLKRIRRRRKNRLAAIRSRSRKDGKTTELQQQVDNLLAENLQQKDLIRALSLRLAAFEAKATAKPTF